jgi:hypothetical protein
MKAIGLLCQFEDKSSHDSVGCQEIQGHMQIRRRPSLLRVLEESKEFDRI